MGLTFNDVPIRIKEIFKPPVRQRWYPEPGVGLHFLIDYDRGLSPAQIKEREGYNGMDRYNKELDKIADWISAAIQEKWDRDYGGDNE